jgi:pyruvate/2-oxoglutarate dehydrogenase complex dihydrolipoamide dehydrogenase (E3) component
MMAVLQLAMMGNVRYDQLRDAIFAHPTLAESLNNLFVARVLTAPGRRHR